MLARILSVASLFMIAAGPLANAQNGDQPKAEPAKLDTSRGDAMIADYFRRETAKIADACLADIQTAEDWNAKKDEYRRQLHEMLGLDPLPEKTDLQAKITGTLDHAEFTVEKLHFQSRPGLYVTGNLYVPKVRAGKVPAILYVCGHGNVKKDGISYGAKSHYQHHGAWFARNGYVCLVIDTLQLGEIEGIHHGTYRYNMWWWLNRGYTPAGVEAWNCVRALDYLQSRPEVDGEKLGVTGRSGGGAYSWWIAAIDERIKCAVPVAGITDLTNHVVDGCVEGHCDCMYMVNTYRWDYPQVAALVAPRPLLISNTDSDRIFPLDGVVRVFNKARRIYTLLGKRDQIGLNITSGGHLDTQELQVTALRWFNHHLRGYDGPVTNHAEKFFQPEHLKVFDKLPENEINTKIHETFVATAPPPKVPESKEEWEQMREGWMKQLKEKSLRAWPTQTVPLDVEKKVDVKRDGLRLQIFEFTSEPGIRLPIYALEKLSNEGHEIGVAAPAGEPSWSQFGGALRRAFPEQAAEVAVGDPAAKPIDLYAEGQEPLGYVGYFVVPRGVGATAWSQSDKKQVQNRRRFMLLGTTLETMQAWDLRRGLEAIRLINEPQPQKLALSGGGSSTTGGVCLLTSLFEPDLGRIDLDLRGVESPAVFLNAARVMNHSAFAALAADRGPLMMTVDEEADWIYPRDVAARLGWDSQRVRINQSTAPAAR